MDGRTRYVFATTALAVILAAAGCEGETAAPAAQPPDAATATDSDTFDAVDDAGDAAPPATTRDTRQGEVPACAPCQSDADCGAAQACHALSGGRFCLTACGSAAACPSGWVCDDAAVCLPEAGSCQPACLRTGCAAGETCDQAAGSATVGTCVAALDLCAVCDADGPCGPGRRCATDAGGTARCLDACPDGQCPEWARCMGRDGPHGDMLLVCHPRRADCCGPACADCPMPCTGPTPHCLTPVCVQCLSDAHCGNGCICDLYTHICGCGLGCNGLCAPPYPGCAVVEGVPSCVVCSADEHCDPGQACDLERFECVRHPLCVEADCPPERRVCTVEDGAVVCVACATDAHCRAEERCDLATATCQPHPGCAALACAGAYPACVVIRGDAFCVPCTRDEHCPGGVCETLTHTCDIPPPVVGDCLADGCPASESFDLACDPASGYCWDRNGFCDEEVAFCNGAQGSSCFPFLLGQAAPDPPADSPLPPGASLCECDPAAQHLCDRDPADPACTDGPVCYPGQICVPVMSAAARAIIGASGMAFCVDPALLELR